MYSFKKTIWDLERRESLTETPTNILDIIFKPLVVGSPNQPRIQTHQVRFPAQPLYPTRQLVINLQG